MRTKTIKRTTNETDISLTLNLAEQVRHRLKADVDFWIIC